LFEPREMQRRQATRRLDRARKCPGIARPTRTVRPRLVAIAHQEEVLASGLARRLHQGHVLPHGLQTELQLHGLPALGLDELNLAGALLGRTDSPLACIGHHAVEAGLSLDTGSGAGPDLVERLADRLADQVPERHLDAATATPARVVEAEGMVVHVEGILPDEQVPG